MQCKHIKIFGMVQGVGFRYYTEKIARKYNIVGTVENIDNYVDIYAQGDEASLGQFITAVTDTTNDLLLKNSELLKQNALETATENERGVVDIETLKTTQNDIIETIEQTLRIQEQGRNKRKQAESELNNLETELQQQLLEMKEK